MILVSACLCGIKCNWKGEASPQEAVIELVKNGKALPICPEQLGGLPTPRPPCEQRGDQIFTRKEENVTVPFQRGAEEVLKLAQCCGFKKAILKARSPSCGCGEIYDGSFSEKLTSGDGVLAALLKKHGIEVLSDEDL
jgi:uncharacterized protein YbbK (DUF523 family)